jgi:20S proteasome alpha/beta subunit
VIGTLTIILGARCKDGVLIAADRRIVRGTEYEEEEKIFTPVEGVVAAASGLTGIMDKFLKAVEAGATAARVQSLDEVISGIEDVTAGLRERYEKRLGEDGKGFLEVLVGGLTNLSSGEAEIYHVLPQGYAERIKRYLVIGHGEPYVKPFVKALYREGITCEEMARISTFAILVVERLELNSTVGGKPQIYTIIDNQKAIELPESRIDDLIKETEPNIKRIYEILKNEK